MELWPFQVNAIAQVESIWELGKRRVLIVLPTGCGKTVVAAAIMRRARDAGKSVLFVCHRHELVLQTSEKLTQAGVSHGFIKAGLPERPEEPVQVASIQTLNRRKSAQKHFDLIVMDEVHRDEYSAVHSFSTRSLILGLTATPHRTSATSHNSLCDEYDTMVVGVSYREALEGGYIVGPRIFAPDIPNLSNVNIRAGDFAQEALAEIMGDATLVGSVVSHWEAHAEKKQTIVFSAGVTHAYALKAEFKARGHAAAVVESQTDKDERANLISAYRAGNISVLINCGVFIEGYDAPETHCIVMAVPTKSISKYLQMSGRGCRSAKNKKNYLLLDHAGNVFRFGSPAINRGWELRKRAQRIQQEDKETEAVKRCQKCFYVWDGKGKCPACGTIQIPKVDKVKSSDGKLKEVAEDFPPPSKENLMDSFERHRRKQFAIGFGSGKRGSELHAFVSRQLNRSFSVQFRGKQIILPFDSWMLW